MISQSVKNLYWATAGRLSLLNLYFRRAWFRLSPPQPPIRLNLGCGPRYIDGFVNVEGNLLLKKDLWLDLRHGLPYRDRQVESVYLSHVLEHFPFAAAVALLRECRRTLRAGGGIRVVVPSLETALDAFVRGDAEWFPSWPDDFKSLGGRFNNYLLCRDQHRLLLDRTFLFEIMQEAGFDRPEVSGYGRSAVFAEADLRRLEPEDSRSFFEDSLIVEAVRT